jgi:uncharacterized BrkB/YihY/UPF0761 family membrane protein
VLRAVISQSVNLDFISMRQPKISAATVKAIRAIDRKHLLAFASSLAYYYFLSLLPLLIQFYEPL